MKGTKVFYQLRTENSHFNPDPVIFSFTPNVTHVQVGLCDSSWGTGHIFDFFNTEALTSNVIQQKIGYTKGLEHTSMSVGDVILTEENRAFVCADKGWRELMKDNRTFLEVWK